MKLPRAVVVAATVVFALSLAGVAFFVVAFALFNSWLWDRFGLDGILGWGTTILSGLAVSSGLLLLALGRQETYLTIQKIVLLLCLGFSLAILGLFVPMIVFA
jgi:hypothetical protein